MLALGCRRRNPADEPIAPQDSNCWTLPRQVLEPTGGEETRAMLGPKYLGCQRKTHEEVRNLD